MAVTSSPPDDLAERLQRTLGDQYALDRELGGGGMSRVFLATETSLGRQVVVKVLAPELTSEAFIARFRQEAAVTAQLQHPNIVPVLGFGARDGLLWYVTPFIAGETLRRRLERDGRLPVDEAVRLVREVADALAAAHARGIVHRDIKPENVFLSNGHAVLADFGIARALAGPGSATEGERLTVVGTSVGTPGYMAPEQAAGEMDVDGRADLYSLAVVAYEMLAGDPPFTGPTPRAVLAAHLSQIPRPVTTRRKEVPAAVSSALDRALAKDPADRFATAADFRDALGAARRTPVSWRSIAVGVAAVVLLAAAGALVYGRRARGPAFDDNVIAVAPFEVLDPSLAMWREGIVDVLSSNLDGAGPLRTVSPTTVIRRWSGRADAANAAALAREVHARYAVFGRFVKSGMDSVHATATLVDAQGGHSLGDVDARDVDSRLDRLSDSLTVGILRRLNQTRAIAVVRTASIGSSSLPAIKSYLQAEQFYRRSAWDSAAAYYRQAIAADSMFAPALRHLSDVLGWTLSGENGEIAEHYGYAILAGQRNHHLAPRESLLVVADSNFAALQIRKGMTLAPEAYARRMISTLEYAARQFPSDPEVWHKLGDARYHYLYFAPGVTYASAREAFDRAIALDSSFAPSYLHMPDLALRAQQPDAAARYARRYLALDSTSAQGRAMSALLPFLDPRRSPTANMDSLVQHASFQTVGALFSDLVSWMDTSESQVRFGRAMLALSRSPRVPPDLAAQGRQAYVFALMARGHVAEAAAHVDAASLMGVPQLALLGAIPPDSADRMLVPLLHSRAVGNVGATLRWWAEQRDTTTLQQIRQRLDTARLGPALETYRQRMLANVRGHLALARRDTATALRELAAIPDSICGVDNCFEEWFLKAQLLAAAHRDREALRILENEYLINDVTRPLWHLERARVEERLGMRPKAADDYAYVAAAFIHADPVLQPARDEARKALARLGGEPAARGS